MIYFIIDLMALAAIALSCLNGVPYVADEYGRVATLMDPGQSLPQKRYRLQELTTIGPGGIIDLDCPAASIELQECGFVLSGAEAGVIRQGRTIPAPVVLEEDDLVYLEKDTCLSDTCLVFHNE